MFCESSYLSATRRQGFCIFLSWPYNCFLPCLSQLERLEFANRWHVLSPPFLMHSVTASYIVDSSVSFTPACRRRRDTRVRVRALEEVRNGHLPVTCRRRVGSIWEPWGCFPSCQRILKFRSEFKWKGLFRFLPTGIFGITSGGGPLISVGIFRPKFTVPLLTNRFFALIREFGKGIKKWQEPFLLPAPV